MGETFQRGMCVLLHVYILDQLHFAWGTQQIMFLVVVFGSATVKSRPRLEIYSSHYDHISGHVVNLWQWGWLPCSPVTKIQTALLVWQRKSLIVLISEVLCGPQLPDTIAERKNFHTVRQRLISPMGNLYAAVISAFHLSQHPTGGNKRSY